jgi:ribosomal-protein-alanine N-acetyltransferase
MPIMPTRKNPATLAGNRVHLRSPRRADASAFIAHALRSRTLHRRWVQPPDTAASFAAYVQRYRKVDDDVRNVGLLVLRNEDDALAGVVNFSEIVRGAFQSAYVGYYAFAPLAARGYMSEGLALALDFAFGELALHRVEANVQPANQRSLALVERLGFVQEGYSRRYVRIAGRWRDHARFAMLVEDWKKQRAGVRRRIANAHRD